MAEIGRLDGKGNAVYRRMTVAILVLSVAAIAGTQEPSAKDPKRFSSMKEATGQGNPPRFQKRLETFGDELSSKLGTSDGSTFVGGTPRVVVLRSNTDASGVGICHTADGTNSYAVELFNENFLPLLTDSSQLEIIWSGQINILPAALWQSGLLKCTVTQGGNSVPCSGTENIPVMAQAATTNGVSAWVTYHGYVVIDPNIQTTVSVQLQAFSWAGGSVRACNDTLTLKY